MWIEVLFPWVGIPQILLKYFDPLWQNIIIMIINILYINTVVMSIIIVCKNVREGFKTPVTESVRYKGKKTAMFNKQS